MSLTGKARSNITQTDQLNMMAKHINLLYGNRRLAATPQQINQPIHGTSSPSPTNSSVYLKVAGDVMYGPLAFNTQIASASLSGGNGHVNIGIGSGNYTSNLIVDFTVPSGNLSYIDGAVNDGQTLSIHVINGQTLVIKTDGNIVPVGGIQQSFTGSAVVDFIFDSTISPNGNAGGWIQKTGGASSGGAGSPHNLLDGNIDQDTTAGTVARGDLVTGQGASATWKRLAKGTANQVLAMDGTGTDIIWAAAGSFSYPLTPTFHNYGTTSGTITLDLSATDAHIHKMTLNGAATFVFSNPPANTKNIQFQIQVTQDATGGRIITWPVTVNIVPTQGTGSLQRVVYVCQTTDGGTTYDVFNTDMASTIANAGFAKTDLSNLISTAINTSLVPNLDVTYNEGSASLRFLNVYAQVLKWVAGREIDLKTVSNDGIYYNVNAGEKHAFLSNAVEILHINSANGLTVNSFPTTLGATLAVVGSASFNGNVFLGDTNADRISYSGLVNTDILFDNSAHNLADSTNVLAHAYITELDKVGSIFFNSSGSQMYVTSNGAGTVMNVFGSGYEIATLSNSTSGPIPNNGIIEVNGSAHGTILGNIWVPSFKTVNTGILTNGNPIGGYYHDGFNSTPSRITYAKTIAYVDNKIATHEFGSLHWFVVNDGTMTEMCALSTQALIPIAPMNLGDGFHVFTNLYATTVNASLINLAGGPPFISSSSSMTFNIASGNIYNFNINGVTTFQVYGNTANISNYARFDSGAIDFTLLGYSSASPPVYLGDTQIHGLFQIKNHSVDNIIDFTTSSTFGTMHCEGGIFFQGTSNANRFFIGSPNVFYSGVIFSPRTVSTTQSITANDTMVFCSGNITLTLPSAQTYPGLFITIIKTDGGTTVNVSAPGGQNINGHGTVSFSTIYTTFGVVSNGTNWYCIQNGQQLA